MKRALLAILILILMAIPSVHGVLQNPVLSNGSTQSYLSYLSTFYTAVTEPATGFTTFSGYRTFPISDATGGGDYYNFWADDHGKILIMAYEYGDLTTRQNAATFITRSASFIPGQYGFLSGRGVQSSLYRSGSTGTITDTNYYVSNYMLAVMNASYIESSKVYERAVTLAPVWFNKTYTTQSLSNWLIDLAPTEIWMGNDTSHLRDIAFGTLQPSTQTLTLIETIGSGILGEKSNETIRRTISVVDPLGKITGVTLTLDTIIEKWRPYVTERMYVTNGWSSPIVIANMTMGFASMDHYAIQYIPFFYWQLNSDGSVTSPTPTLLYKGTNVTLWNGGTPYPTAQLVTGFQTPEFASGYKVTLQPPTGVSVARTKFCSCFGHSIQDVMNYGMVSLSPSSTSAVSQFLVNPMEKTDWSSAKTILSFNDLNVPDGRVLTMPGSWGLDVLGLALYAQATADPDILAAAKGVWNFYYPDAASRVNPVWIPQNPAHAPVEYYRSWFTHALAGLMIDPTNSTYQSWAYTTIIQGILGQLDTNPASANYGALPLALEENGWAYALLTRYYQLYGISAYSTIAHGILNAIGYNNGYTVDTMGSWPQSPASCTSNLPSLYVSLSTGGCSGAFSNHPQNIFRSSEFLYAVILGSTFDGTASPLIYNSPQALVVASNLFKMSYSVTGGMSVDVRYPSDLTGQSNSETQALGMLALADWKQRMFNSTVGEYIESETGATMTAVSYNTNGGNLTVSLKGPNSGSVPFKLYSRDVQPGVVQVTGTCPVGSWSAPFLTVTITLSSSGLGTCIFTNANRPVGPNLAIIAGVGAVVAAVAGAIYVNSKRVKS